MNKPYEITIHEFWALAAQVDLPIQNGSIIAQWLLDHESPQSDEVIEEANKALLKKGYLGPNRGENAIPDALLEALLILALSLVKLVASISRGGERIWTTFVQLEGLLVEYSIEDNRLLVHPPVHINEMTQMLVPDWFTPESAGAFSAELSLDAFLLLMAAIQMDEKQSLLAEDGAPPTFERSALLEALQPMREWADFYHEVGIPGITPLEQIPLEETLVDLTAGNYLQDAGDGRLQLGPQADTLVAVYSDPDVCLASFSITGTRDDFPPTGSLLFGGSALLLLQLTENGELTIQQLSKRETAAEWTASLLAKGAAVQPSLPDMAEEADAAATDEAYEAADTGAAEQLVVETAAPPIKKKRTCLIVLGILVVIVICVVLAGLLYDEIMWQLRPRAVGYLPYLLGGVLL